MKYFKKLNSNGFSHVELGVLVAVVLVVVTVGVKLAFFSHADTLTPAVTTASSPTHYETTMLGPKDAGGATVSTNLFNYTKSYNETVSEIGAGTALVYPRNTFYNPSGSRCYVVYLKAPLGTSANVEFGTYSNYATVSLPGSLDEVVCVPGGGSNPGQYDPILNSSNYVLLVKQSFTKN